MHFLTSKNPYALFIYILITKNFGLLYFGHLIFGQKFSDK